MPELSVLPKMDRCSDSVGGSFLCLMSIAFRLEPFLIIELVFAPSELQFESFISPLVSSAAL